MANPEQQSGLEQGETRGPAPEKAVDPVQLEEKGDRRVEAAQEYDVPTPEKPPKPGQREVSERAVERHVENLSTVLKDLPEALDIDENPERQEERIQQAFGMMAAFTEKSLNSVQFERTAGEGLVEQDLAQSKTPPSEDALR